MDLLNSTFFETSKGFPYLSIAKPETVPTREHLSRLWSLGPQTTRLKM